MNSMYASKIICQEVWPDFIRHFKSDTTAASYRTDLEEIMNFFRKDFIEIGLKEAETYFEYMQSKIAAGSIRAATVSKKFRELHSFSGFLCENREQYGISRQYEDVFYPYLKKLEKQKKFANYVEIGLVDKLLKCCDGKLQDYTILTFLYRVGLTSTEITHIRAEDFALYENGMYLYVSRRKELCFIPEDAARIVGTYMEQREEHEYLFYNSRGKQLNLMYISRMMKKLAEKAGIEKCSAESIRNTCAVTMYAYGGSDKQVAGKMGITQMQVQRYKDKSYKERLQEEAESLVRVKVLPPV